MRQRDKQGPQSAEQIAWAYQRATRRHVSVEEKIRIVTQGLRDAYCIAKPRSSATPAIRHSHWRQRTSSLACPCVPHRD
jgi:hypothetical protein